MSSLIKQNVWVDSDDEIQMIGDYEIGKKVAEGTYGTVYDIHNPSNTKTNKVVKLLRHRSIAQENREIEVLMALRKSAAYCIHLEKVHRVRDSTYLIFEKCPIDLEKIISSVKCKPLEIATVKWYMQMLLTGIAKLHDLGILHRDIKPNNLMVTENNELRIIDFGMSRKRSEISTCKDPLKWTTLVISRAYRPPELLFGCKEYDESVDIWSIGCVFAECLLGDVYFPGTTDIDQLGKIFSKLGIPTEERWPGVTKLPSYLEFSSCGGRVPLSTQFPSLSEAGVDLLSDLLELNPSKRISAREALNSSFFKEEPVPINAGTVPKVFEVKKRKREAVEICTEENTSKPAGRRICF